MHAASVPHMPANKCAGTAPTTSSTLTFSRNLMPRMQTSPPIAPMTTDHPIVVMSGAAVMATNPPSAPLSVPRRSTRPNTIRDSANAVMTPAPAARLVLVNTMLIVTALAASPKARTEPPLKPNQPSQRMKMPRVTSGTFDGGVDLTVPSSRNLPVRAPTINMPANAAQPPVECTIVDPAKSWNPICDNQPPPQVHAPTMG